MPIKLIIAAVMSFCCSAAVLAASATNIQLTVTPSSPRPGAPVTIKAKLTGDIVVKRVSPNPQNSTARLHFYVNNAEVGSYLVSDLPRGSTYYRYDTTQRCGPSGSCEMVQLVFLDTSQVEASHNVTMPKSEKSIRVYATFDGDRFSAGSTSGPTTVKSGSSAPVGAIHLLLSQ
ncbi:hypothetical protein [Burkholderia sp. Ac-20392]|uniref:hypothetical protein n=1 Tax=Burkholderia sp. Ac-20392 TaxID=2703905 RepID=UPI001980A192|nr:hypothetical protein [Burkholderia sp. Ac-20392]MBN3799743.1 hypothetical protein [Burkholderia sp. Ac-20392]